MTNSTETVTLTGNFRFRPYKRPYGPILLILQIEERRQFQYTEIGVGGAPPDIDEKFWRDARVEDFLRENFPGRQEVGNAKLQ
jgi:hypothetical protein